jgi:hypothetical protein
VRRKSLGSLLYLSYRAALEKIVAAADGLQVSNHPLRCANHFANTMFNVMRGGVFGDQYLIHKDDLAAFIRGRNRAVLSSHADFFDRNYQ